MPRRRLLLLSNSRDPQGRFLVHATDELRDVLGGAERVLFIPDAGVTTPLADYVALVRGAFGALGVAVDSVHEAADPVAAVREARGIVVGGGNTFHLLARLYERDIVDAIRARVAEGIPYIGWSAGSVVACPTLQTTNDMPIIAPRSFAALGLVPFQINAHYTDFHPPGFQGETRRQRLAEYLVVNPRTRIIGLPEGMMLRVDDDAIALRGVGAEPARLFVAGEEPRAIQPGASLASLLLAAP